MTLVLLALASAAGAVCRYGVDLLVSGKRAGVFPWGTWVINVSGALLLGLLVGAAGGGAVQGRVITVLGTGFLGAFTTFSTFTVETLTLVETGAYRTAAVNVAATLAAGLAAAGLGLAVGAVWW